jgi:hypothetical protein
MVNGTAMTLLKVTRGVLMQWSPAYRISDLAPIQPGEGPVGSRSRDA